MKSNLFVTLIAVKGQPCSVVTGWQHKPLEANAYLVKCGRDSVYICADSEEEAKEIYNRE